jgi:hypothetical protein
VEGKVWEVAVLKGVVIILLSVCAVARAQATAPSSGPAAEMLLRQGMDELNAGHWKEAARLLKDVAGEQQAQAAYGAGIAYMKVGDLKLARKQMDVAWWQQKPRSRELIINRAILDLRDQTAPIRGVREICEYLNVQKEPDEEMVKVLGTIMFKISLDSYLANGKIFKQATAFYVKQVKKLEAKRPGERLWGVKWMGEGEMKAKESERAAAIKRYNDALVEVNNARLKYHDGEMDLEAGRFNALQRHGMEDPFGTGMEAKGRQEMAEGKKDVYEAQQKAKELGKQIPQLPWLEELEPVLPREARMPATTRGAE